MFSKSDRQVIKKLLMIPPFNEGDEIASYIVGISFEDRVFLAQCSKLANCCSKHKAIDRS